MDFLKRHKEIILFVIICVLTFGNIFLVYYFSMSQIKNWKAEAGSDIQEAMIRQLNDKKELNLGLPVRQDDGKVKIQSFIFILKPSPTPTPEPIKNAK